MTTEEQQQRCELVAEARSWVGTPYRLNACVKGAGVDCARLLFGILRNRGLIPDEKIGVFAGDWFCHAKEDTYLLRMLRHAAKIAEAVAHRALEAKPGCLVLTKAARSRVYNHGAIVTEWPRVCHAVHPAVEEIDVTRHPMWAHQRVILLDPFLPSSEAKAHKDEPALLSETKIHSDEPAFLSEAKTRMDEPAPLSEAKTQQ